MSAAKPTPRYVQPIRPNIELVGPTTEAQVIPIRRVTPAYTPTVDPAVDLVATPTPKRRRKRAPVARRPWELLVVSPAPGQPTKTVTVRRWQARLMILSVVVMFVLASGAVAAIVVAVQNPELLDAPAEAEELRGRVAEMEDSLAAVRADLEGAEVAQDSLTELVEKASRSSDASRAKSLEKRRARKTARAHTAPLEILGSDDEAGPVAVGPASVEGLPVVGTIASGFSRSRRHPILHIRRPHLGVDVAAPTGTPIVAPAPGRVRFVGRKFGFGLVVEIQHPNRVVTRYAHLKKAVVSIGDEIARGAIIATVGRSGITTGPHLHYEILVHGRQVDPLRFRIPQPESPPAAVSATPHAQGGGAGGGLTAPPVLSHDAIGPQQIAPMPR